MLGSRAVSTSIPGWISRRCAIALSLALAGCADHYLIPDSAWATLQSVPQESRSRVAVPAIRERDRRATWVRTDLLAVDDAQRVSDLSGYRRVRETENRGRLSGPALGAVAAGVLGLGLSLVFMSTADSCSSPGIFPCIPGSGDWVPPLALSSGILLFTGAGLSLARAADAHPAEPTVDDGEVLFLGAPVLPQPPPAQGPLKTPIE